MKQPRIEESKLGCFP